MAERRIAFLWTPHFGTAVARRAEPQLAGGPLVLLDAHGRVLAADTSAARAGVALGLTERQAAADCPTPHYCPPPLPIWEAQEQFLTRIKGYTDRWQPDGLGRVYLDATTAAPPGHPARVEGELLKWCQALAADVRSLGWQPALGATGSKFGASVAGQVASQTPRCCWSPGAARLPGRSVNRGATAGHRRATQLRHLGIRTLGQYAHLPATGVLARFGPAGRTAQRWAQGSTTGRCSRRGKAPRSQHASSSRRPWRTASACWLRWYSGRIGCVPLRDRLQAVARLLLAITRRWPHNPGQPHLLAAHRRGRAGAPGTGGPPGSDAVGRARPAEIILTLAGITDAPAQQLTLFDPQDDDRARLSALLERLAALFGADAFRLASLTDPDHLLLERRAAFQPCR